MQKCHSQPYDKILIFGATGSGKSTLSRQLAKITGAPVTYLDRLHWQPGWNPAPKEEFTLAIQQVLAQPQWIIDGNYTSTLLEARLEQANLVILLDTCPLRCFTRVWRRHGSKRPDLPAYLEERKEWSADFLAFLAAIFTFRRKGKVKILAAHRTTNTPLLVLKSQKDIARFLHLLESTTSMEVQDSPRPLP